MSCHAMRAVGIRSHFRKIPQTPRRMSLPRHTTAGILALTLLLPGRPASLPAQGAPATAAAPRDTAADRRAVVEAAEGMLKAISTADSALARSLMVPGMQTVSTANDRPPRAPRFGTASDMLGMIGGSTEKFLERMWNPMVSLHGNLAVVQTPYDFYIDGKFSHCGIDVFTLLRTPSGWRVAAMAWTTQASPCAPSPLGPPKD